MIAAHFSEHAVRFLAVLRVARVRRAVPVVVPALVVAQVVQARRAVGRVRPEAGKGKDKALRRVAPVLAAVKALPVLTVRRVPVDGMEARHQAQAEAPVQACPQPIRTVLRAALPG